MISYDILDENVLDEETKAANIPAEEKDNVAVENGNVIQPKEDTEIASKVGVKEAVDFLGNNKLGYNIWDTIVKGV